MHRRAPPWRQQCEDKWTCYDTGLHTALVARWPGHVPAGKRAAAVVQYADVAPTLVKLAGGDPGDRALRFDVTSFTTVVHDESDRNRDFAYGIHNNEPESPEYPIRSVTDGRWRYIRNLTLDEPYVEKHVMGLAGKAGTTNGYWPTWVDAAKTDPAARRLVDRYTRRPAEELYDTATDPFELKNLATVPAATQKNPGWRRNSTAGWRSRAAAEGRQHHVAVRGSATATPRSRRRWRCCRSCTT